jgi:hypothetical protein
MTQFQARNSLTDEEFAVSQAEARIAARREPAPVFGNVGQGAREVVDESMTVANLSDHAYFAAHKAEIFAAAARGELPGQYAYSTTPLDNI